MTRLKRVSDNITLDHDLSSFTVSGDPGCDGYNVEATAVLEAVVGEEADLHLLAGDLVPTGRERWYGQFEEIIARAARAPVYCLAGNHDLPDYEKHLGRANYWLRARKSLFIILDNSSWEFGSGAVALLAEALGSPAEGAEHIFVAFHVPPPNPFAANSVPREEWAKVSHLLQPHRDRVRAVFAGHVHSAFNFELDGLPMLVTGGGGARLDPVANTLCPSGNRHHYIRALLEDGAWRFEAKEILPGGKGLDGAPAVADGLAESFAGECQAWRRYLVFAERALFLGQPGLAKLFRAAADSERLHAENMFLALGGAGDNAANLADAIRREESEWKLDYVRHLAAAREAAGAGGLAVIAFDCALKAEKIHHALFKQALSDLEKGEPVSEKRYFTCSRCGFTHEGEAPPALCPACGTDDKRFVEVQ
jgi:rubrerythrin